MPKRRGNGRGGRNQRGNKDDRPGADRPANKKEDAEDLDLVKGLSEYCSKGSTERKLESFRKVIEFYEALKTRVGDPLKLLLRASGNDDDDDDKVTRCLPPSVDRAISDFSAFLSRVDKLHLPRIQSLYEKTSQGVLSEKMQERGFFSTLDANMLDPKEHALLIRSLFERKALMYRYKNLWTIIEDALSNLQREASNALDGADPSPLFRAAFYHIRDDTFYFVWSLKNNKSVTRIVTLKMPIGQKGNNSYGRVEFSKARDAYRDGVLIILSESGTEAMDRVRLKT